jgi:anaphase-promoting complex subunit 2
MSYSFSSNRFGEESLHSCEVMLRDIEESRRINTQVVNAIKANKSLPQNGPILNCAIISDNYWPPVTSKDGDDASTMTYHPASGAMMTQYFDAFVALKAARKLNMQNHLGCVQLDLDFDDGSCRSFSVDPVQATLIMHMGDCKRMLLSELCAATELDSEDVRKRMQYWVLKHVVTAKDVDDANNYEPEVLYEVDENQRSHADADEKNAGNDAFGGDDAGAAVQSSSAQAKSKLATIETYIRGNRVQLVKAAKFHLMLLGILSSQGSISLDRLHSMLSLMMSDGSSASNFDMTILDLRRYLQTLIEADILENIDGMYRKHPNSK